MFLIVKVSTSAIISPVPFGDSNKCKLFIVEIVCPSILILSTATDGATTAPVKVAPLNIAAPAAVTLVASVTSAAASMRSSLAPSSETSRQSTVSVPEKVKFPVS